MKLVIELKEDRDVRIYSDADIDLTFIDWKDVKDYYEDFHPETLKRELDKAELELFHKTTGLKQVYP